MDVSVLVATKAGSIMGTDRQRVWLYHGLFIPDYQQHGDHEYRSVYHPVYHYHKVTVISSDDQTAGIVKTYVAYEP